jgi:hypothetical protein
MNRIQTNRVVYREKPIQFFTDKINRGEPFAQVGYSDAEWYCILGKRTGEKTGLGQVITTKQGNKLLDVIVRRHFEPRWYFAMPAALWDGSVPITEGDKVGQFLMKKGITLTVYERDMITDDLARDAGLYPLIQAIQKFKGFIYFVGPQPVCDVIGEVIKATIGTFSIPTPNLHLDKKETGKVVQDMIQVLGAKKWDPPVLMLVSAGVSAATLIDTAYSINRYNLYFDCGSIWDAFVGIGGQRQWRADLYADPNKWIAWKEKNIHGSSQ